MHLEGIHTSWPMQERARMHKLSRSHETFVQYRLLVIHLCAKWTPPLVSRRKLPLADDTLKQRDIRLVVTYHPTMAAGLPRRVDSLVIA